MTQDIKMKQAAVNEINSLDGQKMFLMLISNMVIGAIGGAVTEVACLPGNKIDHAALGAAIGSLVGIMNPVKFSLISKAVDFFKSEDSTEVKIGVNLAIDGVFGVMGIINHIFFGAAATLAVMDGVNSEIESYFDHQEAVLYDNLELVS